MRICPRCEEEMIENLDVKLDDKESGINVTQVAFYTTQLGKIKCAVCPNCGYIETYIDYIAKVKRLAMNRKAGQVKKD